MKKTLFTGLMACVMTGSFAQTAFFTKTCYRGAFAPAPAPMWTDTWTEWDPKNKVYPAPTVTVTGDITTNTTWSTGQVVLLSSQCYVKQNSVLTIQPGVIVRGDANVQGAGIFVTKGSQLIANGTVNNPIVFTSSQAPGSRSAGDWGGIILLGKATNNTPGGLNNIEGLAISADTEYGVASGADDNDNSGSLQYVRIEFAGFAYQQDKEINTLTMGAIGRGTTLDYIQASYGLDDAFEWFGGTVNAKHLVSFRCLDDDFDTDFGYSGNVQFCLAVRDPDLADNPSISTSEIFESDNNASGNSATPKTSAIFSNVTAIGPKRGNPGSTVATGHRRSVRIRRNSELRIYNSVFLDASTRGLFIDGSASETNAQNGTLKFKNNILAGYGQRATESGTFGIITPNLNTWVMTMANDTLVSSGGILTTAYNYTAPDYRPSPGSLALSGASFTDAILAPVAAASTATVAMSMPSTHCLGNGSNNQPFTFVPATTVSPNYCALTWSASAGAVLSSSSALNPSVTVSTEGTFSVYLIVTNENGQNSVLQSILTTTCTDVSVKSQSQVLTGVKLYPNPSSDKTLLFVDVANKGKITISIYDITGKLVQHPVVNQEILSGENDFLINTSELNNGIYFVTIQQGNSKETVKLVVNK